jgi:hypothetical protein
MKKLLIYSFTVLVLLWLVRELEYVGVRRSSLPEFSKLRKTFLGSSPADLLILGSSRAACQFYPDSLVKDGKLRIWNAGMTGATIPFFRTTLEAYLVHHSAPKFLVLNIDIHSFNDNNDTVFDYPRYFPYLKNEALYSGLLRQDSRFKWYRCLAPYSLAQGNTRLLNAAFHGLFSDPTCKVLACENGFEASQPKGIIGDLDTIRYAEYAAEPSQRLLNDLDAIIRICEQKRIQLVFVLSPLYKHHRISLKNYQNRVEQLSALTLKYQLNLIDCSMDAISNDKSMYVDGAHLNETGAKVFSARFADSLQTRLKIAQD